MTDTEFIAVLNRIEFEVECEWCKGENQMWMHPANRCQKCNGYGYIPTEIGDKLLSFLDGRV